MGVFICLGAQIHEFEVSDSINFNIFGSFDEIQKYDIWEWSEQYKTKRTQIFTSIKPYFLSSFNTTTIH